MTTLPTDKLRQTFTGHIILPDEADYSLVSNSFIKKGQPAIVLQPKSADDVVQAIHFIKENGLKLSVRSGGHSGAGWSTNDGGAVLDMSLMNQVEVLDEQKNIVKIGAGAKWGDVAQQLSAHGLAVSSGDTTTVGVGGLTLGGGIGWMVRKYGLSVDSVVAAEVVTADGRVLRATEDENADLFWAIRGGGGNFGVVTFFEFSAHKVGKVYAGSIMYELKDVDKLLQGWRDVMRSAPDDLTTMFLIMPSFGGNPPGAMSLVCYSGDLEKAKEVIQPLLEIGTVTNNAVQEKSYADVLEAAHPPEGMRVIVHNAFAKELSDELIKAIAETQKNTPGFILQMRSLGGEMKRRPSESASFAHRDSEVLLISPTFVPPTSTDEQVVAAGKYWEGIAQHVAGSYVNFLSEVSEAETRKAYPEAVYKKLAEVKRKYDPQNVFNQNYNITL